MKPAQVLLAETPVVSADMEPEIDFGLLGDRLVIAFSYRNQNVMTRSSFIFDGVVAHVLKSEMALDVWSVDAYDKLVELADSDWVRQINKVTAARGYPARRLHHYALYLDDLGLVEVIGEAWRLVHAS